MSFLIHGATGAQGGPLFERLLTSGKDAKGAVRNLPDKAHTAFVQIDNSSVDSLVHAYRGMEGVFVHLPVTAEHERAVYAHNIARAVAITRPPRVVISTSGWVVDEPNSPLQNPEDSAIVSLIRAITETGVSVAVVAPRLFFENLLNPLVLGAVKAEGILRYPLRAEYQVSWSSHLDVADVAATLLSHPEITGIVGVGQYPGITGANLAEGFAQSLSRPVSFESVTPKAFGEMIAPMFGEGPAAGVVAGYQAQALAECNVINEQTSAQKRLGMQPRSFQQWLTDVSVEA